MIYQIHLNNLPIDNVISSTRLLIFYRNQYEVTLQNTVWRKPNVLMCNLKKKTEEKLSKFDYVTP